MSDALAIYAVRLADDALIYGQRLAQWCSYGPTLEEDLALANVALDYIGRARMFYQFAGSISGRSEDELRE
jgi:ring-1,2-phenylacetyl-CoA epoxidase subunit PaaC